MKTIKIIILISLLSASYGLSGPRLDINGGDRPNYVYSPDAIVLAQQTLDGNNISSFFYNSGVFNINLGGSNAASFQWPKGTGKTACFTAGLSMGCFINGQLREAMNSYKGELAPGYIEIVNNAPVAKTDGRFRLYRIKSSDNAGNNPDYAQWGDMVPYGAPYFDANGNGQYDPGIDKPGVKDAAVTIFGCLTDGFPEEHKVGEGFGGGTPPMYAEYQFTTWCYDTPGLTDLQFIKWVVTNKNVSNWERLYMGVTVDPDLGNSDDDYIGCDTARDMGFCYNGDNDDAGQPWAYGVNPPAFGMDYFTSPVNRIDPNDSTTWVTLGLSSFVYFTNTSTPGPACEKDPNGEAVPAYYMLQGLKKDQTPWVIPNTNPPQTTKFCYPGDPESGQGWNEGLPGQISGAVQNCGGLLTGTTVGVNAVGDRRFIFNSGAENFTMRPGESQTIILAQFVARGSSNLNSVTQLKRVDDVAQKIFDLNFNVIPPPPPPVVTTSLRKTLSGNAEISLMWGDTSEYYNYQDTIFAQPSDSSYYKFEGYMVFELDPTASTVPDITDPAANLDDLKLLAIYDKKDTIGYVIDTFKVGTTGNQDIYAPLNVVPPNRYSAPAGFPNAGISRHITITTTQFPEHHGGSTAIIYGQTYKYIVIAYAYNTRPKARGFAINRNSLDSRLLTVVPQQPLAGSRFIYKNGDTLNSNRRDLGVMPIVVAQENVIEATYRVLFNSPDTTYNLFRSINGGNFDLVKANLKYTNYGASNSTLADDSSRIVDGILFKVQKIRFKSENPSGNYSGSVGVIPDLLLSRDSIQTRQNGWDYTPSENNPYDSSRFSVNPTYKPYQSRSMSISYPTRNTYIGFRSLLNPEDLRKVKIVFTGYGNGQQAYRYLSTGVVNFTYQDMQEVPFKVYEIDPFDGTATDRQLNCGFLEFPGSTQDNKWEPTTDSTGGREILYIFNSDYNPAPVPPYSTANLYLQQATVDIMYVWNPRLKTAGASFRNGDVFTIYPYTVTRPNVTAGNPLFYDVTTQAAVIGSSEVARDNGSLADVKVVPNPYYGANSQETSISGRFLTFTRLPKECTIKIYTINGDMIKILAKNDNNATMLWNMTNLENVPVASGMYIALVDAPGIGTKILKMAIFTPEERLDF
jgi:hypothetical protein